MIQQEDVNQRELFNLLKVGIITLAGNRTLKIYGRLNCASGKRMKKENRVFFVNEAEAITYRFRPCGHCMREQYKEWKRISTL